MITKKHLKQLGFVMRERGLFGFTNNGVHSKISILTIGDRQMYIIADVLYLKPNTYPAFMARWGAYARINLRRISIKCFKTWVEIFATAEGMLMLELAFRTHEDIQSNVWFGTITKE